MSERALQVAFFPLAAALALTFVASIVLAWTTGYVYPQEISRESYLSLGRALAPILGASILAAAIVAHLLRVKRDQIENSLLKWLDEQGEPIPDRWNEGVELVLEETAAMISIGSQGRTIEQALRDRKRLVRIRKYASRLFVLPILALATLVAISLWAVPASEMFLNISFPALNTTFVFLTSYGTAVAVVAAVAAMLLVPVE